MTMQSPVIPIANLATLTKKETDERSPSELDVGLSLNEDHAEEIPSEFHFAKSCHKKGEVPRFTPGSLYFKFYFQHYELMLKDGFFCNWEVRVEREQDEDNVDVFSLALGQLTGVSSTFRLDLPYQGPPPRSGRFWYHNAKNSSFRFVVLISVVGLDEPLEPCRFEFPKFTLKNPAEAARQQRRKRSRIERQRRELADFLKAPLPNQPNKYRRNFEATGGEEEELDMAPWHLPAFAEAARAIYRMQRQFDTLKRERDEAVAELARLKRSKTSSEDEAQGGAPAPTDHQQQQQLGNSPGLVQLLSNCSIESQPEEGEGDDAGADSQAANQLVELAQTRTPLRVASDAGDDIIVPVTPPSTC